MKKKVLLGLALAALVVLAPLAMGALDDSAPAAPCSCCGEACTCADCSCDADGCACSDGGSCACNGDCCSTCCAD
ncbi:MAG: hypothetical protein MUC56_01050 [Thermoanaerobaculales bacterium]|nr:hypothetical protein [Thermoanaerobaculales bacterium]